MRNPFFTFSWWTALLVLPSIGAAVHQDAMFERIKIVGANHPNGIFDVSVDYDDDGVGWLAYSEVELPKYVDTHLARSADGGKTWTYVGSVNKSVDGVKLLNGKRIEGVWRYETPTLVFDRNDRPSRRWKLFVQKYFAVAPYKKGDSMFAQGHVEYRHAARPDGHWSAPICLFGPVDLGCRVNLNELHASLRDMVFYNEFGSTVIDGTLYMSLDASPTASGLGSWDKRRIVLIASPDGGESWKYVGTLTDFEDAEQFGYRVLTGSSLVKENGRVYLLVTPSGRKGFFVKNRGHDGTLILAFDDITRASLKRDKDGKLIALTHIEPSLHSGGLSDYHEKNTYGGILFSQIDPASGPKVFKAFSTRVRISH